MTTSKPYTPVRCVANDPDPDGTPHWKYRVRPGDVWSGVSFPTEQLARAARSLRHHEELTNPAPCMYGHLGCSCSYSGGPPGGPCMDEQAGILEAAGFDLGDLD